MNVFYTHRCDSCGFESDKVLGRMSEPARTNCPVCDQETFLRRVTKTPAIHVGQRLKNDGYEYREDLARFPGDRRAYVDGPRAVQNLIDQTKREGATVRPVSDARSDPPTTDPNRNLAREAYEAAAAKGFQVEE